MNLSNYECIIVCDKLYKYFLDQCAYTPAQNSRASEPAVLIINVFKKRNDRCVVKTNSLYRLSIIHVFSQTLIYFYSKIYTIDCKVCTFRDNSFFLTLQRFVIILLFIIIIIIIHYHLPF